MIQMIQEAGINTEMYFESDKLAKQFKFADKKNIPFVVICGPEEIETTEVTIKIMSSGKQKRIPLMQVAEYFKNSMNLSN